MTAAVAVEQPQRNPVVASVRMLWLWSWAILTLPIHAVLCMGGSRGFATRTGYKVPVWAMLLAGLVVLRVLGI